MRVIPALVVVAACTGGGGGGTDEPSPNPDTLWFAQNAARTAMVLTDVQPHPF